MSQKTFRQAGFYRCAGHHISYLWPAQEDLAAEEEANIRPIRPKVPRAPEIRKRITRTPSPFRRPPAQIEATTAREGFGRPLVSRQGQFALAGLLLADADGRRAAPFLSPAHLARAWRRASPQVVYLWIGWARRLLHTDEVRAYRARLAREGDAPTPKRK